MLQKRTRVAVYVGVGLALAAAGGGSLLVSPGQNAPMAASVRALSQDTGTLVDDVMADLAHDA
ncbi:MAG TPA: hypothetical protein DDX54_03870 [Rhodospirillaceae bacterium]|jgi:hypothetical protein|nr:hypothetical protein [Alphaproteobacteria bacterium]HBH26521.1 hypothetical protein [Rhodospirillaceae bacterium]